MNSKIYTLIVALLLTMSSAWAQLQFSGGDGTANEPFLISTVEDLRELTEYSGDLTDVYFELMNDIDLTEYLSSGDGFVDWGSAGWKPIGSRKVLYSSNNYEYYFDGHFDGADHKIKGLTIDRSVPASAHLSTGFFERLSSNGSIKDLSIEIAGVVKGASNTGGLVGTNDGTITNCRIDGDVEGSGGDIGGLVGYNNASIINCHVEGNIKGLTADAGGIVGENKGTIDGCSFSGTVICGYFPGGIAGNNNNTESKIINCIAECDVKQEGNSSDGAGGIVGVFSGGLMSNCHFTGVVEGIGGVGGLVGVYTVYGDIIDCTVNASVEGSGDDIGGIIGRRVFASGGGIRNCRFEGDVKGGGDNVGGFIGRSTGGFIEECYVLGGTVQSGGVRVGGFIGHHNGASIKDCYATGDVIVGGSIGAFVGVHSSGSITNCYADCATVDDFAGSTSGGIANSVYAGSELGEITGRLASGWDDDVWGVSDKNYPYLKNLPVCTVTFDNVTNTTTATVNYGIRVLQPISRRGYTFVSWFTAANGGTSVVLPVPVKQDMKFYSTWTPNPYDITFDANEGRVDIDKKTVIFDSAVGDLPEPIRLRYVFGGWFYGDKEYTKETIYDIDNDITLVARWYRETEIIKDVQDAVVCPGTDFQVLEVEAVGVNMQYHWFCNGEKVAVTTQNKYGVDGIKDGYSANYHVEVSGDYGVAEGRVANVRMAIPLPSEPVFASAPTGMLEAGIAYTFTVANYTDVAPFLWSSESGTAEISSSQGSSVTIRFFEPGTETINVRLMHFCSGSVTLSQTFTVGNSTGLGVVEDNSLSVYPNPTSGLTTITGLTVGKEFYLYSVAGELVRTYIAQVEGMTIDLSPLGSGMYFLNVDGQTVRIIKN